jgi:hypothetical protein
VANDSGSNHGGQRIQGEHVDRHRMLDTASVTDFPARPIAVDRLARVAWAADMCKLPITLVARVCTDKCWGNPLQGA